MAGQIDDLLLLSHLDEERTLARARPVLALIARDAAHDVRARGPARAITVDAGGPVV